MSQAAPCVRVQSVPPRSSYTASSNHGHYIGPLFKQQSLAFQCHVSIMRVLQRTSVRIPVIVFSLLHCVQINVVHNLCFEMIALTLSLL